MNKPADSSSIVEKPDILQPGGGQKTFRKENSSLHFYLLPFCLGMIALSAQIILVREFLNLFYGNELVIGVVLSNWMLLTAAGARLGKAGRQALRSLPLMLVALMLLSILAPSTLLLAEILKNTAFPAGSMIGISGIFISTLFMLIPFCLLSGFLFTSLTAYLAEYWQQDTASRVYSYESLGSVAGIFMVNFILVFLLQPFHSLLLILVFTAIITGFLSIKQQNRLLSIGILLITVIVLSLSFFFQPDKSARQLLYPGQKIESYTDTPFGALLVTSAEGQRNVYSNSTLLFSSGDIISREESVHYAMLQRPDTRRVLLVEGGASGSLHEILKYPVHQVDYLEFNPWILDLGRKFSKDTGNSRVKVYKGDIRDYLGKISVTYDIVLLQVPEPSTLLSNRYYTLEFFRMLRTRMSPGGVVSLSLIPSPNYMGREASQVHSVVYNTLGKLFPFVVIIPGERNYFLASDSTIDSGIAHLALRSGIATEYVNEYYLNDDDIARRSRVIIGSLDLQTPVNHDFKPVAFFGQLNYWLSYDNHPGAMILVIILILFVIVAIMLRPVTGAVMVTGFTASSLEIILLIVFQVLFGNLYLMTGGFMMLFMAGLWVGSSSKKLFFGKPAFSSLVIIQLAQGAFCLLVLIALLLFDKFAPAAVPAYVILLGLVLFIALLGGIQFRCSCSVLGGNPWRTAGPLYSSDLLGSAFGTLLTTILVIPVIGMELTLLFIGGLNFVIGLLMFMRRKRFLLS